MISTGDLVNAMLETKDGDLNEQQLIFVGYEPKIDRYLCRFISQPENATPLVVALEVNEIEDEPNEFGGEVKKRIPNQNGDIRSAIELLLSDLVDGFKSNATMLSQYDKTRGLDSISGAFLDIPSKEEIVKSNGHKYFQLPICSSLSWDEIRGILMTAKEHAYELDTIMDVIDPSNERMGYLTQHNDLVELLELFPEI